MKNKDKEKLQDIKKQFNKLSKSAKRDFFIYIGEHKDSVDLLSFSKQISDDFIWPHFVCDKEVEKFIDDK